MEQGPEGEVQSGCDGKRRPAATKIFSDGTIIELIRADQKSRLELLVWKDDRALVCRRYQHGNRCYTPSNLDRSTANAIRLPTHAVDPGTTHDLVTALKRIFSPSELGKREAALLSYFVISTWFIDCLSVAPCIQITGASEQTSLVFEILQCLCRRPLLLGDFRAGSVRSLPMRWRPTLLIYQPDLSRAAAKLLNVSSTRGCYLPGSDRLHDFFCAKAVRSTRLSPEDAIQLHFTPSLLSLSHLTHSDKQRLALEYQPKLLGYRLRNHQVVSGTVVEHANPLKSMLRGTGDALASCIVGSPELQAEVFSLLQLQEDHVWTERLGQADLVVIEALLALCHEQKPNAYTLEITNFANGILNARGVRANLTAHAVGRILRNLPLTRTKRDRRGYNLIFSRAVRQQIHELARQFDLPSVPNQDCNECRVPGSNAQEGDVLCTL